MKFHPFHIAILLLIFFSAACKKEKKDTTSPSISISNPTSGQPFNMFDTLVVSAHVSDETHLSSVVVSLVDANNIVLQYSLNVYIQSNDFTFSIPYILNEFRLTSGTYYISVVASDGTNRTQRTQAIAVTESPTTKSGYFIVGAGQPNLVVKYSNTGAQQSVITLASTYHGMAFGAYYQQLFLNGGINQPFVAYDVTMGGTAWTLPYNGNGLPTFEYVTTDGQKAYIGYYSGYVGSETYTGGTSTGYSFGSNNYYPYYFTLTSKYAVGAYHDIFGGGDKIATFLHAGVSVNNIFLPLTPVAIFEHTQDELYVLGNNSVGQGIYYLYNVTTNGFQGPFTLPTGKLYAAALVDSDYLLVSAGNNVYGFQHSSGNSTVQASILAQKLIYNPKMRELNAAAGKLVYSYSLSTNYALIPGINYSVADSIIGFEVITNK